MHRNITFRIITGDLNQFNFYFRFLSILCTICSIHSLTLIEWLCGVVVVPRITTWAIWDKFPPRCVWKLWRWGFPPMVPLGTRLSAPRSTIRKNNSSWTLGFFMTHRMTFIGTQPKAFSRLRNVKFGILFFLLSFFAAAWKYRINSTN